MRRVAVLESNAGIGGAEVNVLRLAQPLRDYGWELKVFVPSDGPLTDALKKRGIAWRHVPTSHFKSTSKYWGRVKVVDPAAVLLDTAVILQQAGTLARLLHEEGVDLVHTNSILSHLTGGLACRYAGIPCVWHLQDIVEKDSGLGLFSRILLWSAAAMPDYVICISQAVAQQFRSPKVRRKLKVIHNGVDVGEFTPKGGQPYRAGWLGNEYKFVVGQVGRLTPWKGQELLLSVAKHARDEGKPIRFVVVGDDNSGHPGYRVKLQTLADQMGLGDQVVFAGWLEDIPGALRSLDVLVHPSLSPEPFGLAVAEAMACGKPVVVANHGGASEVVGSNQNGVLVPPGNIRACYDAIKYVLSQPAVAQRLGESARARVEANFSLSQFTEQVAGIYSSVTSRMEVS